MYRVSPIGSKMYNLAWCSMESVDERNRGGGGGGGNSLYRRDGNIEEGGFKGAIMTLMNN